MFWKKFVSCLLHCLLEVSRKLCFSLMQSMFCACISVDFSHFCFFFSFFFSSLPSSSSPQIDSVAYLIAYTNNIYLLIFQIFIFVYGVLIFQFDLSKFQTIHVCHCICMSTYFPHFTYFCFILLYVSEFIYFSSIKYLSYDYFLLLLLLLLLFFFFGQLFSFDIVLLSILI